LSFRSIFFDFVCLCALAIFLGPLQAEEPKQSHISLERQRAEEASHYTVKITSKLGDVVTGKTETSHGTGVILEFRGDYGWIATNEHVVQKSDFEAQKITLEFPSGVKNRRPELIEARVVLVSKQTDGAIILFNRKDLKRVGHRIKAASLITAEEEEQIVAKGEGIMLFGWPEESQEVTTFGRITGVDQYIGDGDELWGTNENILTDAAVNPGNSGGPMVHVQTGKVIGLNSVKDESADNMGWALPLRHLLEEFELVKKDKKSGARGYLHLLTSSIAADQFNDIAQLAALKEVIEQQIPGFFEENDGGIIVREVTEGSGLQQGDFILKVEDEVIGDQDRRITRIVNRSARNVKFRIIRGLKAKTITVPIESRRGHEVRRRHEYVEFAGLILQDLNVDEKSNLYKGEEGVVVRKIRTESFAARSTEIEEGSLITRIRSDRISRRIKSLADLREAIKDIGKDELVYVFHQNPLELASEDDDDEEESEKTLSREIEMSLLTLVDIVTSQEKPLKKMIEEFDFSGGYRKRKKTASKTRCAKNLKKVPGEIM